MIYMFNQINDFTEDLMEKAIQYLPLARQKKIKRYRNVVDQKLGIIAYLLLLKGLREEYGIIKLPELDYLKYGKPVLRDYPHIYFNISHCSEGVVCALYDRPVGIDIQDEVEFDIDVAKQVCSEMELELILASENQGKEFCKIWTAKESIVKLSGRGITQDLKSLDISRVKTICYEKFIISVAV